MDAEAQEAYEAFVDLMGGCVEYVELPEIVRKVAPWLATVNEVELAFCLQKEWNHNRDKLSEPRLRFDDLIPDVFDGQLIILQFQIFVGIDLIVAVVIIKIVVFVGKIAGIKIFAKVFEIIYKRYCWIFRGFFLCFIITILICNLFYLKSYGISKSLNIKVTLPRI